MVSMVKKIFSKNPQPKEMHCKPIGIMHPPCPVNHHKQIVDLHKRRLITLNQ